MKLAPIDYIITIFTFIKYFENYNSKKKKKKKKKYFIFFLNIKF